MCYNHWERGVFRTYQENVAVLVMSVSFSYLCLHLNKLTVFLITSLGDES